MSRTARVVITGYPHHITQRGNYSQDVFTDDEDRNRYLKWIKEYSDKFGVEILAYSLMTNHVHYIAVPKKENSLARTFSVAHMRYSQYFNKKMGTRGHLWQGRFYSCVLDEYHLIRASRYVERNPVRAGFVKKPWEWKWSSVSAHIGCESTDILKLKALFKIIDMTEKAWKAYIDCEDNKEDIDKIKRLTMTGRPLGENGFSENLEETFGRKMAALPIGRPRKAEK